MFRINKHFLSGHTPIVLVRTAPREEATAGRTAGMQRRDGRSTACRRGPAQPSVAARISVARPEETVHTPTHSNAPTTHGQVCHPALVSSFSMLEVLFILCQWIFIFVLRYTCPFHLLAQHAGERGRSQYSEIERVDWMPSVHAMWKE